MASVGANAGLGEQSVLGQDECIPAGARWSGSPPSPTEHLAPTVETMLGSPAPVCGWRLYHGFCALLGLVGLEGRRAEVVAGEALPRTIDFETAGQRPLGSPALQPGHALGAPLAGCDKPQVQHVGCVAQQLPRVASDQNHVASGDGLSDSFGQAVNVLLVGRMQTETVGHTDGLLI